MIRGGSYVRYPNGEDMFFHLWGMFETPEQKEKRLKESQSKEVERRKREMEAKKKARELLKQRVKDQISKVRENRRMGIESTHMEEEDPDRVWEEREEERNKRLIGQGYKMVPPFRGIDGPEVKRIQPKKMKKEFESLSIRS